MRERITTHTRQTATQTLPPPSAPPPAIASPPVVPNPPQGGLEAFLEKAEKEILAVTYWFTPAPHPSPYPVTIKFSGHRVGVEGNLQPGDQFLHYETIDAVVPGSGPISITTRISDVNRGKWEVVASEQSSTLLPRGKGKRQELATLPTTDGFLVRAWRWWAPSVGKREADHIEVATCLPPYARTPGALLGSWIGFVVLGIVLALLTQSLVLTQEHLAVGPAWTVRILGLISGFIGAKAWFLAKHGREGRWEGWCIQGFVAGTTLVVVGLLLLYHIAVGNYLDATAPGLLLGMAVGRIGCFFGGCCGGPPTAARWGVWSSDQRVGARRVPTQLMEAAFTLGLGLMAWAIVAGHGLAGGAVFIASIAAYTLGRQAVLHLRMEKDPLQRQGRIIAVIAALVLVAALLFIIVHKGAH